MQNSWKVVYIFTADSWNWPISWIFWREYKFKKQTYFNIYTRKYYSDSFIYKIHCGKHIILFSDLKNRSIAFTTYKLLNTPAEQVWASCSIILGGPNIKTRNYHNKWSWRETLSFVCFLLKIHKVIWGLKSDCNYSYMPFYYIFLGYIKKKFSAGNRKEWKLRFNASIDDNYTTNHIIF